MNNYLQEALIERTKKLIDFQADKIVIHTSEVITHRKELAALESKKKLSEDETKRKTEHASNIKNALEDVRMAKLRAETLSELLDNLTNNKSIDL